MPRGHSSYKDPYYYPKNMFKKNRAKYAAMTTYKLPEHLKPILEEYLKKPQPKFDKKYYCMCMHHCDVSRDLKNFILSIVPDRRTVDGRDSVYMIRRQKGMKGFFLLKEKNKDKLLPAIFEAIEKGIF